MFHSAQTLAPLEGAKLERLRLSLNSPVLAVESLPVGPAAAGIAVHRASSGARITIAIRSVRGGQVLFFHPDEAWKEGESEHLALEAALSFAESMGFLFDEDPLEKGATTAAAESLWSGFLREVPPEAAHGGGVADAPPPDATDVTEAPDPSTVAEAHEAFAAVPAVTEAVVPCPADEGASATPADDPAAPLDAAVPLVADDPAVPRLPDAAVPLVAGDLDDAVVPLLDDAAVVPGPPDVAADEPPMRDPSTLLSKFRFLSSIPADRLLGPPPVEEPVRHGSVVHDDSVLRLLSRF